MKDERQVNRLFTRRDLLGVFGSFIGLATLGACENTSRRAAACTVTPQGEIGPYFVDDAERRFRRSNILANTDGTEVQSGIPLELTLYIVDAENACRPMQGVQVDIWHCNAEGIYSDIDRENTVGLTWLRGYQLSDSAGKLVFNTIIPGWYPGRATHIHLRLRSKFSDTASPFDSTNTTQLFFPQATVDLINSTVDPYQSKGSNTTTNANDHVYTRQTGGKMVLQLEGNSCDGYRSSTTISLPLASEFAFD